MLDAFDAWDTAPLKMWLILSGNLDAEAGKADVMADVVVVADSSSEDEKKHLETDAPPAKTNGASRKRGSSAVLENDDPQERSNEEKDSKSEVHARNLRKRSSKVSYAEKEDDYITNRRRTPSKKKPAKEKSIEDKVDGMKEEVAQDGAKESQDTGDAVAADVTGGPPSRKAPKKRSSAVDAETKEQKRLAAEAAVRLKEVRHSSVCVTMSLHSFRNLIFILLVCKEIYFWHSKI